MQGSHDMARALTFMVLVLSNLTLILSNRSWQMPVWRQALAGNRPLRWAVLGTLVLLVAVLGVPQLGALFAFALPTGPMLLTGVAVAVLGLLWFEAVKKVQSC